MERQIQQQEGHGADTTGEDRSHHKERRLRWLGQVMRIYDNRLPRQAVHWDIL